MDVRLTAPDGYEAQRSYSIASAPEQTDALELAIERLQDGEVSPFFHDDVLVGDEIELRGPIGGHFVWSVDDGGPVLLVGGGSGVVPLASMLRHHAAQASDVPVTLVVFGDARRRTLCISTSCARYAAARAASPDRHGHARGAGRGRSGPAGSTGHCWHSALAQSMPPPSARSSAEPMPSSRR